MTRILLAGLVAALLALPTFATAQAPDVDDPWDAGRAAYAAEDFDEAARFIIEAIQREPENPQYYLGLARTEYWRGDFDRAVHYYDIYLGELAGRVSPDVRSADRLDRVRSERESANGERNDPASAPPAPAGPTAAYEALRTRLAEGPILTTTGGGALALYRGTLRSGYVNPNLVEMRTRLANALIAEAAENVRDHHASIPHLSLVQWETQRERFEAWLELVPMPEQTGPATDIPAEALDPAAVQTTDPWSRARAHVAFCDAQIQALNGNHLQAAEGFRVALDLMPSFVPAHMGRLNALYRLGNANQSAADEVTTFEAVLGAYAPAQMAVADVYRAAFAAQSRDIDYAARTLGELLGIPMEP